MPIDEHRLLLWVLTELAEDSRVQIEALTLQRLLSEILETVVTPSALSCFSSQ